MSIRRWKEKERNLNCSISSIVNDCGQKYCQKIAKAYCFAIGFGDFGLEGVVLRKKSTSSQQTGRGACLSFIISPTAVIIK